MPQLLHVVVAATLACVPVFASGYCFSLYDAQNQLVRQTSEPLVNMSRPIAQQVEVLFPGHFLIVGSNSDCPEVGRSRAAAPYDGTQREPTEIPIFQAAQRRELASGTSGTPGAQSQAGQGIGGVGGRPGASPTKPSAPSSTSNSGSYKR